MSVASMVRDKIKRIDSGAVIKYNDFKKISQNSVALSKALSKLVKENELERIEKGVFFKPKKTKFGTVGPNIIDIIKKELEINKKITGYITGLNLYNKLGLTTQISNIIEIATNKRKSSKIISGRKVKFIQTSSKINKNNINLLQLLDAIKNIKKIPDSDINETYKLLKYKINNLEKEEKKKIIELSLDYSPVTRAVLGSILEENKILNLDILENSLNIFTKFKLNINNMKNKKRWNIE